MQERKILSSPKFSLLRITSMNTEETTETAGCKVEGLQLPWYFMCDQKRRNALEPAYKMLERKGFEVFTPLQNKVIGKGKFKKIVEEPIFTDILFVHSTVEKIDKIVAETTTLHYRFKKGGKYCEHITVPDKEMQRFKYALEHTEIKEWYSIDALPREIIGERMVVQGGPLDGYKVIARKMQGARKKRVFFELKKLAYAELEITDFISLKKYKGNDWDED